MIINDLMLYMSCCDGDRGGQSARLLLNELLDSGQVQVDFFSFLLVILPGFIYCITIYYILLNKYFFFKFRCLLNFVILMISRNIFFTIPWPKIPLSLPAAKRECGSFGPGMKKNRIRNMGIKSASPEHMFSTLAFGTGGNLYVLCTGQLFTSLVA